MSGYLLKRGYTEISFETVEDVIDYLTLIDSPLSEYEIIEKEAP